MGPRAKIRGSLAVLTVVALAAGIPWWRAAGRDESRHRRAVQFTGTWSVFSHDRGKELRSDSALVTWHAGDEQSYSHVHHGGKYNSEPIILGPGTHLLIIKIEVDTATETTCAIVLGGNVGNVKDTSATGRCSRSVTIVVK
jgi:hypothetical protein